MTNSSSRFEAVAVQIVALAAIVAAGACAGFGLPLVAVASSAVALVATGFGFYRLLSCQNAILRAIRTADALGRGDFEVRDPTLAPHGLPGRLTNAINDMADHIDAFVRESSAAMEAVRQNRYHRRILPHGMQGALLRASTTINDATDAIQARTKTFEASTDSFAATINSIVEALVASSVSVSDVSERLGAAANATTEQATSVATSSRDASSNVERATDAARNLSDRARSIGVEVDRSANAARTAVERAKETEAIVSSLSEAAKRIGTVIGLIDQVASQTNLLALNATIEAARAGEAGRGFAVVASEVKQLASETAKATQEIVKHIGQVQAATNEAVNSIIGIGGTIAEIDTITASMRQSIEGQIAASNAIAENVGSAHGETRAVSERIADISSISRETAGLAGGLRGTSSTVSSEGERLAATVRDFLSSLRRGPLDRRQSAEPRYAVNIAVEAQEQRFTCAELSSSGARFIGFAGKVAKGSRLAVRINAGIVLPGVVRWQDGSSFGMEFLTSEFSADVMNWLSERIKSSTAIAA